MLFPFAFIAIAGAAIAAALSRHRQTNEAWAAAAQELGITLKPTGGLGGLTNRASMSGMISGLRVTIDTYRSNDRTYTRYRVGYPSLGLGLQAKRQHALARLGTFFGFQDIEIGDPVFDEALIVKGDYPEQVTAFLTPSRRVAITGLIENYPGTVITDTVITYLRNGIVADPAELTSTLRRIMAVAQELRGVDRYAEQAGSRRLEGDVTEALEILEGAPPSGDPFIDFSRKQQVGEIRYARGDADGAKEVFDELRRQAPADPEIARWARDRAAPAPAVPGAGEPNEDAAAVAEHLFRKENYSFDTMEIFENEYEGKAVSWSGELKRLRRFDHDRDFGEGPGVKAVFRVAVLGTDLYSGRDVDAIVRLPHGTEDRLEIGRRYAFRGTLSRCDPAMRNLFVTDADLG